MIEQAQLQVASLTLILLFNFRAHRLTIPCLPHPHRGATIGAVTTGSGGLRIGKATLGVTIPGVTTIGVTLGSLLRTLHGILRSITIPPARHRTRGTRPRKSSNF